MIRGAITALAAVVILSGCSGAGGTQSASNGFPAGARPAIAQHANPAVGSVHTLALDDSSVLMWKTQPPQTTTAAAPIMNAFVSLSQAFSGLPCFNCVGSPPNPNGFGMAFAQPDLALGSSAEEVYTFEDESVTASCTLKFQFKQNGATLATYSFKNIEISPGTFLFYHAGGLPSNAVAGPATTTGDMVCPGLTTKPAMENIYFH